MKRKKYRQREKQSRRQIEGQAVTNANRKTNRIDVQKDKVKKEEHFFLNQFKRQRNEREDK